MNREVVPIKDKAHWLGLKAEDISSTEVSALFGLNPYVTEFELWHRKKDKAIIEIEENDRLKWGSRLESAIAEGIAEDQGWRVYQMKDYIRIPELRASSSFDYFIDDEAGPGILEIKNVDTLQFREKWLIENGQVLEAPPHIEMQCQHQLFVSGREFLFIGALIGGNTIVMIKRTPNKNIIEQIQTRIRGFWDSIEQNLPPEPNFERDAEFVASLYQNVNKGSVINVEEDKDLALLADEYKRASLAEKAAQNMKKAVKAQILQRIDKAHKAVGKEFTISAGTIAAVEVEAHVREARRDFRINWRKKKDDKSNQ